MSEQKDKSVDLEGENKPYNEYEQNCEKVIREKLGDEVVDGIPRSMLTQFIRGYAGEKDPENETAERLKACLAWRKEFGADEILNEPEDGEFVKAFEAFRKKWPTGIHGQGKHGRPIYIERLGAVEPSEVFEEYTLEQIERFHVYQIEKLNRYKRQISRKLGKTVYKGIVVVDLNGFGMKHMGSKLRTPMKKVMHIDQHYYPESLHRMVVINAPWLFKTLWKVVRPWVHPVTQTRIVFGKEHLLDHMDASQIPSFVDGSECKCAGGECLFAPFDDGSSDAYTVERANAEDPEQPAATKKASDEEDGDAEEDADATKKPEPSAPPAE